MTKAVIRLGYTDYVVELEEAVAITNALANAEEFQQVGYGDDRAYYIWREPKADRVTIQVINDELYRVASMAGKPENK